MTLDQAKQILLAWRPGHPEETRGELAEALSLARRDPALGAWLARHQSFQQGVQRRFQSITPPADLTRRILDRGTATAAHKRNSGAAVRGPRSWWQRPAWLAAAAAVVLLLCWCGPLLLRKQEAEQAGFATFRSRMVGLVLRQYSMDIVTNDMVQIRQFLAQRQAPADYVLPGDLQALPVSGGGVLSWRDQRVAMVCFDTPETGTLFLFVVPASSVQSPPESTPRYEQVSRLMTASWSRQGKTYIAATSGDRAALQKYLRGLESGSVPPCHPPAGPTLRLQADPRPVHLASQRTSPR